MNDPMNLTSVTLARSPAFRLGGFEVKPPTREVIGTDCREVLEPRVMQVLVALAQANGDVVTRDDLMLRCWEGRVVGDDALNRVIGKIRRLAARPDSGFALETIRKVGYRLITAPASAEASPALPVAGEDRAELRRRRLRWPWFAAGFAAVVLTAWVALAASLPSAPAGASLAGATALSPTGAAALPQGEAEAGPHSRAAALGLAEDFDVDVANGPTGQPLTGAARPAAAEPPLPDAGGSSRPMSLLPPA